MITSRLRTRSLRLRVLATAVTVFAISLAVAVFLAYELLLQDGRRDADIVLSREQDRFETSMRELLVEAEQDDPQASSEETLRAAVRRYLQLNPSTDSYWTIVTFTDGSRLAAANGPPLLAPLFRGEDGAALPEGRPNTRETIPTPVGDIRTLTVPVRVDEVQIATFQVLAPMAPVRDEAIEAGLLIALAAGLALVVGGGLLGVTLWRSLAPLGTLADAAKDTDLRSLGSRVPEPETSDEVGILAREFNTMLERLERSNAQQREFMASIGHELRTPITIARGHLELLEGVRGDPAVLPEAVGIVQDELARMGRLVEDLMAIARAEMEDFVRPRRVELVQWFEDLELRLAGTDAGRVTALQPPPPIIVALDPDRLAQAILNLVINAQVHTPDGTRITVRASESGNDLKLQVLDDGPGIAEEIREELFLPFRRAGDSPGSTGLGLAVVAAVMDAHGGRTEVETGTNGSCFTLVLPAVVVEGTTAEPATLVAPPRPDRRLDG